MNVKVIAALIAAGSVVSITALVLWRSQTDPADGQSSVAAGGAAQIAPMQRHTLVADRAETDELFTVREREFLLELIARVERLEAAASVDRGNPSREIASLQKRVAALERSERMGRRASPTADNSTKSLANDIAQLKRETSSLKRVQGQLASKIDTTTIRAYAPRSDLSSLQQKVFALESTVRRLESR